MFKKTKIYITSAFLLISIFSHGQENKHISLGFTFTPLNYSNLKARNNDFDSLKRVRNVLENKSYAFSTSLKIGIKARPKLYLETGIGLSFLTSHSNEIYGNSRYFRGTNNIVKEKYIVRYSMVDIPVTTRYSLSIWELPLHFITGVTLGKVFSRDLVMKQTTQSGEQLQNTESIPITATKNNWVVSGQLGLQTEFDLKKLTFRIESPLVTFFQMRYKMMLTSLWTNSIIEKYHGLDFGCGIRYKLKKVQ